jgi:hypothetical protein
MPGQGDKPLGLPRGDQTRDVFKRYKPENESYASFTTYVNDKHLWFPMVSYGAYAISVYLKYIIDLDGDAKFRWDLPRGYDTDSHWGAWYEPAGGGTIATVGPLPVDTDLTFVITTTTSGVATLFGTIMNGSSAGVAQMQWAQVLSDPGGITLYKGCWLTATRVF